jgi:hypothetical protein
MEKLIEKIQHLLSKLDSSTYREIYNFNYNIEADTSFMDKKIPPALIGDEIERAELIEEMVDICRSKGLESRQCVLHKKYQDDNSLAACLSTIQAISRCGKIDLHIFVRSQNFDKNFCYDNQTYMKIMYTLKANWPEYDFGKIYVHITSLHRFMEDNKSPLIFC